VLITVVVLVMLVVPAVVLVVGAGHLPTRTASSPARQSSAPSVPVTRDEARAVLESNGLYSQHLSPTTCHVDDTDYASASTSQDEERMASFVQCLLDAWTGPVAAAGFSLPRPQVTVYPRAASGPCGDLRGGVSYCRADKAIYYSGTYLQARPQALVVESALAHEFAHLVQEQVQILWSHGMVAGGEDEAGGRDLHRRKELQADCMAGAVLNSVSQSLGLTTADRERVVEFFAEVADATAYEGNHGTAVNRAYWAGAGLATTSAGTCNTFAAPADRVS